MAGAGTFTAPATSAFWEVPELAREAQMRGSHCTALAVAAVLLAGCDPVEPAGTPNPTPTGGSVSSESQPVAPGPSTPTETPFEPGTPPAFPGQMTAPNDPRPSGGVP